MSEHQNVLPSPPDVPADVDGLRALLGDAIVRGIYLMKDGTPDCRSVLIGRGTSFHVQDDPHLARGVHGLVHYAAEQIRHVFPRHMADGSRAQPHLLFLAEWAVLTGTYAYRNHVVRRKKSRAQAGLFRGLPVDPRWLADAADLLLQSVLPTLHVVGVPIPGTTEFLERHS